MTRNGYSVIQDILEGEAGCLDCISYTETNEGIEVTFSKDELVAYPGGPDSLDIIETLLDAYGFNGKVEYLGEEEEEFITVNLS